MNVEIDGRTDSGAAPDDSTIMRGRNRIDAGKRFRNFARDFGRRHDLRNTTANDNTVVGDRVALAA